MPSVQTTVQRIQASGSEYKAKASLYIQAPLWIIMDGLFVLTGLTIYSYYEAVGCDPFRSGQIYSSNQILPYFIVDVLNFPGLPGIFIAVLFSGALSSVSSSLNGTGISVACYWYQRWHTRFTVVVLNSRHGGKIQRGAFMPYCLFLLMQLI